MKKLLLLSLILPFYMACNAFTPPEGKVENQATPLAGDYTMVVEGFDWGAGVSKVILPMDKNVSTVAPRDFKVTVTRSTDCEKLPEAQAAGERQVIHAYVSDEKGNQLKKGKFVTLQLFVAPYDILGSPIQYFSRGKCSGNQWLDYNMIITHSESEQVWNKEGGRMIPLIDEFDLTGTFTHKDKTTLTYASFTPESEAEKSPLIIWLHGGGEGGTDPTIPLLANRAANYASPEIQAYFGGAYVLVPQTPTFWMDNGKGNYTRGEVDDTYNEALMAMIKDYVAKNPKIDQERIYLGGCSNGGYMTLKLLLNEPDYFAAAFPSALAYFAEHITDQQLKTIKDIPIWFIHSKDDPVTVPNKTVVPTYERLMKAGASNLHFSYFDHVVDITGLYGGDQYYYNGHFSWIYSHTNTCQLDYDRKPVMMNGMAVTLMQWMAAQKRSE